ncbi:MAG: hypothetical protein ACJ759_00040 [Thermoanaerobaculia bacterium]
MTSSPWIWTGAIWVGGGLVSNFAWEMLQMSLYGKFEGGWWGCFQAALGDVVILALLYGLMACAAEGWAWFERLSRWRLLLLALLGFLVAVVVELRALLEGAWSYSAAMPRMPFLNVGWIPVLQMIVIPLGLARLSHTWARK